MPSVLFKFDASEEPHKSHGRPRPGAEALPSDHVPEKRLKKARVVLDARRPEITPVQAVRADEVKHEQKRLRTLEQADQERVQKMKEQIATPLKPGALNEQLIDDEATPLEKRRGIAEDNSSALMQSYLALQKKEKVAQEAKDLQALMDAREDLVLAQTALRAALLRESFLETENPKAARDGHEALKAEEKFLATDAKALKVKEVLEKIRREQKADAITHEMIAKLPGDAQDLATRLFHAENDRRKVDLHVQRLQNWHEKKGALELARVEAITHCKSCNIPNNIREAITNETLSAAEKRINLNRVTSDGYTREFDKPRNLKESLIQAGLSIARTLGIETKRKFANGELEGYMQKVNHLQKEFDAIADTKGAFKGRRVPYVQRAKDSDFYRSPLGFTLSQGEAIIGRSEFANNGSQEAQGMQVLHSFTEEANAFIVSLKNPKTTLEASRFKTAERAFHTLQQKLQPLSNTALVYTGEYHQAQTQLAKAEQALKKVESVYTAEQKRVDAAKEEITSLSRLAQRALDLSREIDLREHLMGPGDLQEAEQKIISLQQDLAKRKKRSPSLEYTAAEDAIEEAQESLRAAKVTVKSNTERPTQLKERIIRRAKQDPRRAERTESIERLIADATRNYSGEVEALREQLLQQDPKHDPDTIIPETYLRMAHLIADSDTPPAVRQSAEKTLDRINTVLGVYENLKVTDLKGLSKKVRTRRKKAA